MSNTALLFMFFCFAGLFLAIVKHPIYGMYSYMLVFYMSPGEAWWSSDVPNFPWSFLTAAVTMVAVFRYPSPSFRPPWYQVGSARWLILFSIWLWVQTIWALNLDDHIFMATLFTKYVILYAVLYTCLSEPKNIRQFYFAHIIGSFLWGYVAYQNPGSGRLENLGSGDVAGSAFASMHIGTGLAFAGFAFLGVSGIRRWLAFSSLPFILNAIILMATRGAFVGLLGGAFAAIFLSPKSSRRFVVLSIALAPILLFMLANELFWSRMSTIVPPDDGQQMESSAESRFTIAQANYQMFLDHPMGVGHRGNETLSPSYLPFNIMTNKGGTRVRAAHNTFMAILVDHGFIGLGLVVLFHLSIVLSLIRARSRYSPSLVKESGISAVAPRSMQVINHGNSESVTQAKQTGFRSLAAFNREFSVYAAALGTALVIYWGNAQFVNVTKAEVVIWIAVLSGALQWMEYASLQRDEPVKETETESEMPR